MRVNGICIAVILLGCCLGQAQKSSEPDQPIHKSAVMTVTILQEEGGRVSWSHETNLIAFDSTGKDGYTDIYVITPDSSRLQCLTCDKSIPQLHNGNPSWHLSGEYIVYQAQDPNLSEFPVPDELNTFIASPGMGINNNLWLMTADGSRFWQITHVKDRYGALHPHFSPDGFNLLWSEIISPRMDTIGHWAIKLADFTIENGEVHLSHVQTLRPGNLQLYEVHGFSPDGTKILFSGVKSGGYYYDMEIYIMDVKTGEYQQLTDNDEWDEHAHFTLDGKYIVWVSSEGINQNKGDSLDDIIEYPPKLEYWIMNVDGSNKQRLSGFNHAGAPEYLNIKEGVGLGDFEWGPDGATIVAKMRREHKQEFTVLIEFDLEIVLQNTGNMKHSFDKM
jgi:Tol biopolymer transport system component